MTLEKGNMNDTWHVRYGQSKLRYRGEMGRVEGE